jgi:hypothetical protein
MRNTARVAALVPTMDDSEFHWLKDQLRRPFDQLEIKASDSEIEAIALVIGDSMSHENRSFHRIAHLFHLIDENDPILTLAALFHDVVYFQVDGILPDKTAKFLNSILIEADDGFHLREDRIGANESLSLICDAFGIDLKNKLNPMTGMNELLSALTAANVLGKYVDHPTLLQIAACIEATIPFRREVGGKEPSTILAENIARCCSKYSILMSEMKIDAAVVRAVELANRDVGNFASKDPKWFLGTTWLLLPERNRNLRGVDFNFKDYRSSIEKMSDFFRFLEAPIIFQRYGNSPTAEEAEEGLRLANENIHLARQYLEAKLVSIGLLEALAQKTGGDLPICDFLGAVTHDEDSSARMESFLPTLNSDAEVDFRVLRLLSEGLAFTTKFDLHNSPFAAFILRRLGSYEVERLAKDMREFAAGKIDANEFILLFPADVVAGVAMACSKVCRSRAKALVGVAKDAGASSVR